jgi:hypothetical protein
MHIINNLNEDLANCNFLYEKEVADRLKLEMKLQRQSLILDSFFEIGR